MFYAIKLEFGIVCVGNREGEKNGAPGIEETYIIII